MESPKQKYGPEQEISSENKTEKTYLDRYYEILNELRPQEERGEKTNADIKKEAQERMDGERSPRPGGFGGFIDELNGLEMDFNEQRKRYQEQIKLFKSLAKGEDPKGNRNRIFSDWTDEDFKELLTENARYREQHQDEESK